MLPRAARFGAGLAAATMILAACGGDDADIVLYSGRGESLVQPAIDQFEEATGLTVEVRYGSTAEMAAQLLEEGDATDADVFFGQDAGALGALSKAGMLAQLPSEYLDRVDSAFQAADGTWVGTSGRARVLVYDSERLTEDELPDSVLDLTAPEWNGRVAIAPGNASYQAFVTALRVMHGDAAAREWLEGMVANDFESFDNNILILEAVEGGLAEVGLINHYYWYGLVDEEGDSDSVTSRLKFMPGDVGGIVNVAGVGVIETTDSTDAAHEFVEYMLSEDAQAYFAEETKEYPLIEGVSIIEGLSQIDDLDPPALDLSDLDTLEETLEMIEDSGMS
jgi:iron(III) transport system substrate-binding protein